MNEDTIADLKQFIATTVAQQTVAITNDIGKEIKNLDDRLSTKIDDLSRSVAEALDVSNEATDQQVKDHDQRIMRLEQKAA